MNDQTTSTLNGKDASIQSLAGSLQNGTMVRVVIDLAENHGNPDLELELIDSDDRVVSHSTIMGAMDQHIEFTLHIRLPNARFPVRLTCSSIFNESVCDSKSIEISAY